MVIFNGFIAKIVQCALTIFRHISHCQQDEGRHSFHNFQLLL